MHAHASAAAAAAATASAASAGRTSCCTAAGWGHLRRPCKCTAAEPVRHQHLRASGGGRHRAHDGQVQPGRASSRRWQASGATRGLVAMQAVHSHSPGVAPTAIAQRLSCGALVARALQAACAQHHAHHAGAVLWIRCARCVRGVSRSYPGLAAATALGRYITHMVAWGEGGTRVSLLPSRVPTLAASR